MATNGPGPALAIELTNSILAVRTLVIVESEFESIDTTMLGSDTRDIIWGKSNRVSETAEFMLMAICSSTEFNDSNWKGLTEQRAALQINISI